LNPKPKRADQDEVDVDFVRLSLLVEKKDGISLTKRGRRVMREVQIRPV
jgi:hypothetical protein